MNPINFLDNAMRLMRSSGTWLREVEEKAKVTNILSSITLFGNTSFSPNLRCPVVARIHANLVETSHVEISNTSTVKKVVVKFIVALGEMLKQLYLHLRLDSTDNAAWVFEQYVHSD